MDKIRIISDLHMLDKGRRDDCLAEGRLITFAEDCYDNDFHLVLNGDIIDLWQKGDISQIFRSYYLFFRLLAANAAKTTMIAGNHDYDPLGRSLAKEMWKRYGIRVYKSLIIDNVAGGLGIPIPHDMSPYARYKSSEPKGGLLVLHGHQFDQLAKSKLGWLAAVLAGVIEKHWWRDIDLAYYFLRKKLSPPYLNGQYYSSLAYQARLLEVHNIVFGHTHIARRVAHDTHRVSSQIWDIDSNFFRCNIMNSGCWVNGNSDYVEYSNGEWKLEVW